jgi:hypothetical protein
LVRAIWEELWLPFRGLQPQETKSATTFANVAVVGGPGIIERIGQLGSDLGTFGTYLMYVSTLFVLHTYGQAVPRYITEYLHMYFTTCLGSTHLLLEPLAESLGRRYNLASSHFHLQRVKDG